MEENSETRSDIQTMCSSRNSFFKYPHVWKSKSKRSINSFGSPQLGASEEVSVDEVFEMEYVNVLKGMWREVFEYFGKK